MCGHGTIGLVASLAYLGRIKPGTVGIETPVGTVSATVHDDGSVSVRNVVAYRLHHALAVDVPAAAASLTWPGAATGSFSSANTVSALPPTTFPRSPIMPMRCAVDSTRKVYAATTARPSITSNCSPLAATLPTVATSFCVGGAYDRSPCGTGTSARSPVWRPTANWHREKSGCRRASLAASLRSYVLEAGRDHPTLRGRAHLSAEATLLIEESDPFAFGIRL